MVTIRPARLEDDDDLARIDAVTWSPLASITPRQDAPRPFFTASGQVGDVLVAEAGEAVAGYIRIVHPTPYPSSVHVFEIRGLGVDPAWQRRGIGRALIAGAVAAARDRGARRVTLRVLATNAGARALSESCGFVVEGVLHGEFHLGGRDVDDLFMAYAIP